LRIDPGQSFPLLGLTTSVLYSALGFLSFTLLSDQAFLESCTCLRDSSTHVIARDREVKILASLEREHHKSNHFTLHRDDRTPTTPWR
jgi:hypothetical protein